MTFDASGRTVSLDLDGRRVVASRLDGADSTRPFVLFVHGAAMDRSVWAAQLQGLAAQGYGALAVDLPGHGESEGPALAEIPALGRWLVHLVETVEPPFAGRRVVLCGHSMGSLAVLAAAPELGERLAGLVLIGSAAHMRVNAELLAAAEARDLATAAHIAKWSFGPAASAELRQRCADLIRKGIATLGDDLAACDAFVEAESLAEHLRCPVIVLCGESDRMTPSAEAARLAAAFPEARLILRPEAGHMVMQEDAVATTELIEGLLSA